MSTSGYTQYTPDKKDHVALALTPVSEHLPFAANSKNVEGSATSNARPVSEWGWGGSRPLSAPTQRSPARLATARFCSTLVPLI